MSKQSIKIDVDVTQNGANVTAHVVPTGRTLLTKDEYLPSPKQKSPSKSEGPKARRWVAVIDKNDSEELAVVKLTTKNTPNSTALPTYQKGNGQSTYFKHFVETRDNEGKPIVVDGDKFKENHSKYDLTATEVKTIQNKVYHNVKESQRNNNLIKKLKNK